MIFVNQCLRNSSSFWSDDNQDTTFFELFLESQASGAPELFPIPLLCKNLKSQNGEFPNKEAKRRWKLTYRFHLVDKIRFERQDFASLQVVNSIVLNSGIHYHFVPLADPTATLRRNL